MSFTLQKDEIKKIPFHHGQMVEYQKGFILSSSQEKLFRFTYSTEPILGKYRVTLHDESGEKHTTYTFALVNHVDQLHIECENKQAMDLLNPITNKLGDHFQQLLSLIMKNGIQNQNS